MKVSQKFYYIPEDPLYTTAVKEKYTLDTNLIEYPCSMYLDQATKTGLCVYDKRRRLVTTIRLVKDDRANIVEFRSEFRQKLHELIDKYRVDKIFCEDVYGGVNFDTVQKLNSIKDTIIDVAYEKGIKAYPLVNTKWKSRLASPGKWVQYLDDKEQIRVLVKKYYPEIKFEDDVLDSVGMAIAVLFKKDPSVRPLHMVLDKKLKLDLIVKPVKMYQLENIVGIIEGTKFKKKLSSMEHKLFDYDTTLDLKTNFRYILTNFNVIAITQIPYHRYYGQILMEYDIIPKELEEDDIIVGIAIRKY